ncbi:hypothetical protein XI06_27125 [Bradyrhizobium sp. CCBAU 11434]|uniref:hypothetical protein n=1 Tax=Bradyrhizobium sp. CCBAU 11434 TaxID=1630885 RepID=UPI0023050E24|nr:hypothetical protein [Bradyrhizobium sp. CCBAU 11434]MDA9523852.1 hypothetical protein [Bradyrhizobium sp. CCBAU 11434]
MAGDHLQLHDELEQGVDLVGLAIALAGLAVAAVSEEVRAVLFRQQLLLQLSAEEMADGVGTQPLFGDFGFREDRLEELVEAITERRPAAGRV